MEMEEMKLKANPKKKKTKLRSRSSRNSPRLHDMDGLPKFMQPLKLPWSVQPEQRVRRPKAEIVRELRRLRAMPTPLDDDEEQQQHQQQQLAMTAAEPISTLEQLDAVRLTRHRIEQLLHTNSFEQVVRNCFVRINISPPNMPHEYRIAEIMDVVELDEGYFVGKTPTNIVLNLRYEDLMENFELTAISNMAFNLEEFELWRDNCICQGIESPTTELITRKKIELYNALNCEGKISSMLQKKGLLPLMVPMRPLPRGGLLERVGGVYPWKLQRPPPPPPPLPPLLQPKSEPDAPCSSEAAAQAIQQPLLELEVLKEPKMPNTQGSESQEASFD